ncbi:hypothetical protein MMYC01_202766 [Madurella mycetomatis]|uniref:Uncharacterized protein n=1 Tax=Madurella mycetomatis TaxID=100816 RepID=A0A175WC33_9PEZI|nr:hypothetical protein MMYC01_202766 [Madurella mycetomatis]
MDHTNIVNPLWGSSGGAIPHPQVGPFLPAQRLRAARPARERLYPRGLPPRRSSRSRHLASLRKRKSAPSWSRGGCKKLRCIAEKLLACNGHPADFLFLRTHYDGGEEDAKLREWLDAGPPEASISPAPERVFTEESVERARENVDESHDPNIYDEDYEEEIQHEASGYVSWLIVVDEEAFETGELGFIYRDKKGNVVREGPARDMWRETDPWGQSVPGKKYRSKGKIMRELLPRVKAGSVMDR